MKFFIIIPADTPHGPVKGAYALANSLSQYRDVTLVSIKSGSGANSPLSPSVKKVCLAEHAERYTERIRLFRQLIATAGKRHEVASISMCLSADAFNLSCRDLALVCSSVRGNLVENYRLEYGLKGIPLAIAHLISLRFFDCVVAMNHPMADQISRYISKRPFLVGNFVDELNLPRELAIQRDRSFTRFVFVGSLTKRKRPLLLVDAFQSLLRDGFEGRLDFVGDGPLRSRVEEAIDRYQIRHLVQIHGFIKQPFGIVNESDVMVLPSVSEGTSRAALEALFLGVPCVVADVDGNSELIKEDQNGALFSDEATLADAMARAANLSRSLGSKRQVLLPAYCRQEHATDAYIKILEDLNGHV